jgi:F-type H+-transporting ATPase subunit gamma
LLDEFKAGNYRRVVVIYSHYETALKCTPLVRQLLPVDPENMGDMLDDSAAIRKEDMSSYLFEPSAESVLNGLLPRLSRIRLFQAMMESQASEHAARMFAMKNATENAEEVADELETDYNRARQRQVTQEIAEISAGANALNT